jgi:hypothetical protein
MTNKDKTDDNHHEMMKKVTLKVIKERKRKEKKGTETIGKERLFGLNGTKENYTRKGKKKRNETK